MKQEGNSLPSFGKKSECLESGDLALLGIPDSMPHSRVIMRASLVLQWLGIRLPMQGTRVRAPVREDPTCRTAARPVSHNY